MTRIIFLAALTAWSAAAIADDAPKTRLVASLASYHLERGSGYCEINPGIGLEHDLAKDVRFHVGQYEGSKCRPVSYLGASWCLFDLMRGIKACGGVAGFLGYEDDRSKILLAPVPALRVPRVIGKVGANVLFFLPHDDFKGGVGLQAVFD